MGLQIHGTRQHVPSKKLRSKNSLCSLAMVSNQAKDSLTQPAFCCTIPLVICTKFIVRQICFVSDARETGTAFPGFHVHYDCCLVCHNYLLLDETKQDHG